MTARDVAFHHLTRLVKAFPEFPLEPPDTSGLDDRDAALAHAIVDCVVRRWLTLEHLVRLCATRPLGEIDAPVRAALMAGVAQMVLLDRVPLHAAVNESVAWTTLHAGKSASGFVNGILRGVSRLVFGPSAGDRSVPLVKVRRAEWTGARDELPREDGGAVALFSQVLPGPIADRLSVATSHPRPVVERWMAQFGVERARELLWHDVISSPPVVLNTAHAREPLPAGCVPHSTPGCCVFQGSREGLIGLLDARPDLWVQDAASCAAVRSVAGLTPRIVVDLCAGQGTKTRQLASTFPEALVVATDPDAQRGSALAEVAAAFPRVSVRGGAEVRNEFRGGADLVLADVPCTNTGVLPRRSEARYRCDDRQLGRLVSIQREILGTAAGLLSPGGVLLYSTCSLEREENESQARWAAETLGLRLESQDRVVPAGVPGGGAEGYRDGAYSAVLRLREGGGVAGSA